MIDVISCAMLRGSCHCGNLAVELETEHPPAQMQVRADQCSFCMRHAARSISDPKGRLTIVVEDERLLSRYRFGLRTADFLICARCGVYVAAIFSEEDRAWAVLNCNVLDKRAAFGAAEPVDYDGETVESRQTRRRARWTPARLILARRSQ
jgi:hypothetical protein